MSPSATEVKPQPYLIDCWVRNDPVAARTLLVKPVEPVSGHAGQAWRQAWRAQVLADERGQYDYVQAFYAGLELVAVYSEADPMLPLLRFTFQVGDTDYETWPPERLICAGNRGFEQPPVYGGQV